MKMQDSRVIAADRVTIWSALLSPEVLQDCVPGCQEMTGNADDGFEATVVQKVGPVKATFKGGVTLSERVENESLVLSGQGKGGAAGFAKGEARVTLEDGEDGTTVLTYDVEAKVGGKLAQLGSRIIDGFAKKMADQFFTRFQEAVEGPAEPEEDGGEEPAEGAKKKGWFKRVISG